MGEMYGRNATVDEVLAAMEELSERTLTVLHQRALRYMFGTRYQDPKELLNEACLSVIEGAKEGVGGRKWPVEVPFEAFLTNAMRGIASNERNRLSTRQLVLAVDLVGAEDDADTSALLESLQNEEGKEKQRGLAVDKQLIAAEERAELLRQYDALYDWFKDDSEVAMILMAKEDGLRGAEIQAECDMTKAQYEAALKRLNRGVAKMQARRNGL